MADLRRWLRSPRTQGILLALAYALLALHRLGEVAIVGDDEAREVGIVQDMVAGHWLWPRFNQELLPDKPTLYHWLAAVPCAVTGFSEVAVRLPSILAAADPQVCDDVHAPTSLRNSSSSMRVTPSYSARASFEPASSPTTT